MYWNISTITTSPGLGIARDKNTSFGIYQNILLPDKKKDNNLVIKYIKTILVFMKRRNASANYYLIN
jgi:hypothetical protein